MIKHNNIRFFSYVARKNINAIPSGNDAIYICKYNPNEFNTKHPDYLKREVISPWHDINILSEESRQKIKSPTIENMLKNSNDLTFNFVVEIPYGTSAKCEVSKELPHNPIIQDVKKAKDNTKYNRFIKLAYRTTYGMIPQTWEHNKVELLPGMIGDDDPLDALEITNSPVYAGDVISVDIVGAFCLIDQDEVDWKILTVSKDYLKRHKISGKEYFENYKKTDGINLILNNFKKYKLYEGKGLNTIYQEDKNNGIIDRDEAIKVVMHSHKDYLDNRDILIKRSSKH